MLQTPPAPVKSRLDALGDALLRDLGPERACSTWRSSVPPMASRDRDPSRDEDGHRKGCGRAAGVRRRPGDGLVCGDRLTSLRVPIPPRDRRMNP